MNLKNFFVNLGRNAARSATKYGPTAAVVGGVALMIFGAVEACKATLEVDEIKENFEEKKQAIKDALEDETIESYTEESAKKDTVTLYTQTAVKYVKKYAKAAVLMGIGVALIFGGHKIIKKQLAGAVAAAESTASAFTRYREHVKEKLGVDADKAFLLGDIQHVVDEETKEEIKDEKFVVDGPNPKQLGPFVFKFDDTCSQWCDDPLRRNYRISAILDTLQDKLEASYRSKSGTRYLTKNDFVRAFGGKTDGEGLTIGWIIPTDNDITKIDLGSFWDEVFLESRTSDGRIHEYQLFDLNCQYIGDKL